MTIDSGVLNAREAAAFLGAHVETVRRLARRGGIPSFKVGKDWRFRKEALLAWTDEQRMSAPPSHCSVLVVDDDHLFCRMISRILNRSGCRAIQALRGEEGLEIVARQAPDLILLDLKMPGMNGPQFLEELRKTHPDLPVVIVTGYPDSELMVQAMQYAPVMLLSKPVERELLERTVRAVVGDKIAARRTGYTIRGTLI